MTRILLAALLAFTPLAAFSDHAPASAADAQNAASAFMHANHQMGASMNAASTGDVDADFIIGMRAHHLGAIDMSNVLLDYGTDPATRALAEQIIAAQADEITWMTEWLVSHGYE